MKDIRKRLPLMLSRSYKDNGVMKAAKAHREQVLLLKAVFTRRVTPLWKKESLR